MKKVGDSFPVYTIEVGRAARKQLVQLPEKDKSAITAAIDTLAFTPRPSGVKKLKGVEGYRIRIGDYRVQYLIFNAVLLIEVVKIGQRGNFYNE